MDDPYASINGLLSSELERRSIDDLVQNCLSLGYDSSN